MGMKASIIAGRENTVTECEGGSAIERLRERSW